MERHPLYIWLIVMGNISLTYYFEIKQAFLQDDKKAEPPSGQSFPISYPATFLIALMHMPQDTGQALIFLD